MSTSLRVLFVEDSENDALLLLHELRRGGYEPVWERVDTAAALAAALEQQPWDIVLCDYGMPQFSGPAALELVRTHYRDLPVIMVSGQAGEEFAVAAMKAGAQDYVVKHQLARLVPAIERELCEVKVRHDRERAEAALRESEQRLRQAHEEEAQVSAALARVGRELIASLDRPVLLERLCRLTAEVLECDCSHTIFWDPAQHGYAVAAGYGDTAEQSEALRVLKIPPAVVGGLITRLQREEVAQVALTEPQELMQANFSLQYGVTVVMCSALRRGEDLIGMHTAGYRGRRTSFTPQQERVMRGIAQLASFALEHARVVEELERANRLKYDFVATMSHELRSPINIIMGYSDLLIGGDFGPLSAEQSDVVGRVETAARDLLELINATLDLSRLEAGKLAPELRDIRLSELLREIAAETRDLQQKPGVDFRWDVPERLPRLRTDPLKLKVVIKNLLRNAAKFTDSGSVTVSAAARKGGVEIAVSDTGVGIAPDMQPIIFEPFRQADGSATRRHGGVGLGLYIVRRLLDLIGGKVAVESELGRGSTFHVWLPANRQPRTS